MYVPVIRSWVKKIFFEPDSWLKISGIFLLCSLPLVTLGWAWGVAIRLGRREIAGQKLCCFQTLRESIDHRSLLFIFMGILDLCAFFFLALSIFTLAFGNAPFSARIAGAFFFWINLVLLCSGMYRYPLAVYNEEIVLAEIYLKGFLLVFSRPGETFLFLMVALSAFLASLLAGVTLFLFLPGATALLSVFIYGDLAKETHPLKT